ncbi:hypothetical protein WEI85_18010 [Actinomycetes bacterium KLBMP 9797]
MLRRRGVVALWEPRRASARFDLDEEFEKAANAVSNDPEALVYGDALAMTIDELKPKSHIRARFMTLRSKDSSPVRYDPRSGLTPISIPSGSYIADVMHLILKPGGWHDSDEQSSRSGCVIFDRHDNGPTLGELSQYLNDFLRIPVSLVSLYNRDLRQELEDMAGQLRKVEVGFLAHKANGLPKEGLFANLTALTRGEEIPSVGVSLGVGRAKPDAYLPSDIQNDIMDIVGDAGEFVERMKLAGRLRSTGTVKEVNILRQRIGEHLEFVPNPGAPTMPNPSDAYRKLDAMYADLSARGVIEQAVSARLLIRS